MKKELLALRRLGIGLRARLGDKESENRLIERMDRALKMSIGAKARFGDEEGIKNLVDSLNRAVGAVGYDDAACFFDGVISDLLLCGTNECIKTVLNFFAKFQPRLNSFGYTHKEQFGTCPHRSDFASNPRESIIRSFRKHHPQLSLIHEEFDSLEARSVRQWRKEGLARFDETEIIKYMERFLAWANKEYGTNFKLESKFLFGWQRDDEILSRKMREKRERYLNETDGKKWSLIDENEAWEVYRIIKADGEEEYISINKHK